MSKYKIERTNRFKKQYEKINTRNNFDEKSFFEVLNFLANGEHLPEKYRNHLLEPKKERSMGMSYKARFIIAIYEK